MPTLLGLKCEFADRQCEGKLHKLLPLRERWLKQEMAEGPVQKKKRSDEKKQRPRVAAEDDQLQKVLHSDLCFAMA